ncbi:ATP-binding protein [Sphaerisporangium fuscum]|uniref:ATP-binding protein n=1 Tax=Sphaerisporangium fuscum TaxID=2835868 RepID=UPI001BDC1512|nr:ATP-binding protein [Sphaerisporangium fuscum]
MPFHSWDGEVRLAAGPLTFAPAAGAVRPGAEMLLWRRVFPGTPDRASEARRFVRFLLDGTSFADDAELVAGELVGNAVRHTRSGTSGGHFTVEVSFFTTSAGTSVLITVYDQGGEGVPRLGDGGGQGLSYEENGRGLAIVAAVADRLGAQGTPEDGHGVWAYLTAAP